MVSQPINMADMVKNRTFGGNASFINFQIINCRTEKRHTKRKSDKLFICLAYYLEKCKDR